MSVLRTLRTVRHLRTRQVVGQLWRRVRPKLERPARLTGLPAPTFPGVRWQPVGRFLPPGCQQNTAADVLAGRLTFLNEARAVGWPPVWDQPGAPRLWQYNLHYFEPLWALDYEQGRAMVADWIERHRLAHGAVGWEPYPISLRLMNWCAGLVGRFGEKLDRDFQFRDQLWASVWLQAQWLERHLEVHLMGNHLFENGAALALVGSCFAGDDADRWFRIGCEVLERQIPEQVLADGGHFELSPMYHSRILYLLAMLSNTGEARLRALVAEPLGRMTEAMVRMCHPDGGIALLNDSAEGVYNAPAALVEYSRSLLGEGGGGRAGPFALPQSGYYGWRGDGGDYLLCDAGPIGPDYIPGHAHGDMFGFELSLGGRRVIVDAGVYDYVRSRMRAYCRSTAAHNTVEIDGQDQCELWDVFRVARRGQPHEVTFEPFDGGFRLSGWHDGYRRLAGRPIHERRFVWYEAGVLMIRDTVRGSKSMDVTSRLHLHPDCEIGVRTDKEMLVASPTGMLRVAIAGLGVLSVEDSWYCPQFGRRMENRAIVVKATGSAVETALCIARSDQAVSIDLKAGAMVHGQRCGW